MDRLPEDKKLDISRTFESQRESVNSHIILIIQKLINKKIFPVIDGIIKHIIHEHHWHQREKNLNNKRRTDWNDTKKWRKYANSWYSDISKKSVNYLFVSWYYLINFYHLETRALIENNRQINKIRRSIVKKFL